MMVVFVPVEAQQGVKLRVSQLIAANLPGELTIVINVISPARNDHPVGVRDDSADGYRTVLERLPGFFQACLPDWVEIRPLQSHIPR